MGHDPKGSKCKAFSDPLPVELHLLLPEMTCESLYAVVPTTEAEPSLGVQSFTEAWSHNTVGHLQG